MKISENTLDILKGFVTGDNNFTPTQKGKQLVHLFNSYGCNDFYDSGMPEGLSRGDYTFSRLKQINGTGDLKGLVEHVFSDAHFADSSLDKVKAADRFNVQLIKENLKLILVGGEYQVNGAENHIPEKKSEIHFEQIQTQIIDEIGKAKFLVWAAVAWFTDDKIYKKLVEKKTEGLSIQVVISEDEINEKSGLGYGDFKVYKKPKSGIYKNIMHNKFCIIDLKTVIHGSYNWTRKAGFNNETIAIERNIENVEKFADEFMKLKT